jgi:hypothetical protein
MFRDQRELQAYRRSLAVAFPVIASAACWFVRTRRRIDRLQFEGIRAFVNIA